MDWLKLFRSDDKKGASASLARERLKVVVMHQREGRANGPNWLPNLREELLGVVRRYIQVADSAVQVNVQREDGCEVLEMNIVLPDKD
ncbi:cell division topological specificity factor MinE [Algiphilus sp. W345]|uniref:Cell division topological specificity factor n=1 Tax=Banduia mediterranea TaxID=3075609 RepID=A0ABU2WNJ1_9GAMM|nr:cell division topological specificity factor MinE [Algiphilus sp. W345]MCH9827191.1 cell division topological specificity factor MinE [Gammaproteobacteria bacterium]MDT0499120.1 cell division topological specificity factor MinE [Algiphilus sp. W345]